MTRGQYFKELFRRALRGSVKTTERVHLIVVLVIALLLLAAPFLARLLAVKEEVKTFLEILPLAALFLGFVFYLLWSGYPIYKEVADERDRLRQALEANADKIDVECLKVNVILLGRDSSGGMASVKTIKEAFMAEVYFTLTFFNQCDKRTRLAKMRLELRSSEAEVVLGGIPQEYTGQIVHAQREVVPVQWLDLPPKETVEKSLVYFIGGKELPKLATCDEFRLRAETARGEQLNYLVHKLPKLAEPS